MLVEVEFTYKLEGSNKEYKGTNTVIIDELLSNALKEDIVRILNKENVEVKSAQIHNLIVIYDKNIKV